jgi:hypothetical protein
LRELFFFILEKKEYNKWKKMEWDYFDVDNNNDDGEDTLPLSHPPHIDKGKRKIVESPDYSNDMNSGYDIATASKEKKQTPAPIKSLKQILGDYKRRIGIEAQINAMRQKEWDNVKLALQTGEFKRALNIVKENPDCINPDTFWDFINNTVALLYPSMPPDYFCDINKILTEENLSSLFSYKHMRMMLGKESYLISQVVSKALRIYNPLVDDLTRPDKKMPLVMVILQWPDEKKLEWLVDLAKNTKSMELFSQTFDSKAVDDVLLTMGDLVQDVQQLEGLEQWGERLSVFQKLYNVSLHSSSTEVDRPVLVNQCIWLVVSLALEQSLEKINLYARS